MQGPAFSPQLKKNKLGPVSVIPALKWQTHRWIPTAHGPTSLVLAMSQLQVQSNQHWPLASMQVCTHMFMYYRGYAWKSEGSRIWYFSKPLAELRIKTQLKWVLENEGLHVNTVMVLWNKHLNWLSWCHWCLGHILILFRPKSWWKTNSGPFMSTYPGASSDKLRYHTTWSHRTSVRNPALREPRNSDTAVSFLYQKAPYLKSQPVREKTFTGGQRVCIGS